MRARLTLGGHAPVGARIRVEHQPRARRTRRALAALLGCWALMPVVFFVPPHLPWVLAAFVAGIYLARRYWTGVYVVEGFDGRCPHCGQPLELDAGTRIDPPEWLTCYTCHRRPRLELGERDERAIAATDGG